MTPLHRKKLQQKKKQQLRRKRLLQQQQRKKRLQQQKQKQKKRQQQTQKQKNVINKKKNPKKQKNTKQNSKKNANVNARQNANNKQKLGNTHYYDGKFKEQYKIYRDYDEKNCVTFDYIFLLFNYNIVLDEITEFIQNYKSVNQSIISMKKNAMKTINLFKTQDKQNYDPKNDIHINDILPRVWRFIKNEKDGLLKLIFLEQIADISEKGACSQGRTTRLYQIYALYMDNLML